MRPRAALLILNDTEYQRDGKGCLRTDSRMRAKLSMTLIPVQGWSNFNTGVYGESVWGFGVSGFGWGSARTNSQWRGTSFFRAAPWQRRDLVRWEYHAYSFLGFIQLALPSLGISSIQKAAQPAKHRQGTRPQGGFSGLLRYPSETLDQLTSHVTA
jgi:hypothetical protein